MLIVLNGYPGVGKLAIGRALAPLVAGRLLDVHTVYNLAFALTKFKSPLFYDTTRRVWAVADERILALPEGVPLVVTEVLTHGSAWADEAWARLERLAEARGPLLVVHVRCELEENERRIASPERDRMRKPRDPAMARRNHERGAALMGEGAPRLLRLDATALSPKAAARRVAAWAEGA